MVFVNDYFSPLSLCSVYPPGTPQVRAGSGNTIIVTIPKLSSTYGPLRYIYVYKVHVHV